MKIRNIEIGYCQIKGKLNPRMIDTQQNTQLILTFHNSPQRYLNADLESPQTKAELLTYCQGLATVLEPQDTLKKVSVCAKDLPDYLVDCNGKLWAEDFGYTHTIPCHDCGSDCNNNTDYYMVHNELWNEAVGDETEILLCRKCLESRLGRRLQTEDFTDCPANRN